MGPKAKDTSAYEARIKQLEELLKVKDQELQETNSKLNVMQSKLETMDVDNDDEAIEDGNNEDQNNLTTTTTTTTTVDPSTTTASTTTTATAVDPSTVAVVDLTNVTADHATSETTALNINSEKLSFKDAAANYSMKIPYFQAFEDVDDTDINTFKVSARLWLSRAEDYFILRNIPEAKKSLVAAGSLLGSSYTWYEKARTNCKSDYVPWNEFKEVFRQHAIPGEGEIMLYDRINAAKWKMTNGMSVSQYVKGFYKFKNSIADVETEAVAMTRFVTGLNNNLQNAVVNKKPLTLAQAVNMAYATEAEKENAKAYRDEDVLFKVGHPNRVHKSNRRFFHRGRNNSFKYNGNYRRNNYGGMNNNNNNINRNGNGNNNHGGNRNNYKYRNNNSFSLNNRYNS